MPMLESIEKIRLLRVSKGFYACVKRHMEWHKVKLSKEHEGYWHFVQQHYNSTMLMKNFLLDRFQLLLKQGLNKNHLRKYTVSEEMLSIFVYYLCTKNRRYLQRIMHTVIPHLDPVSRRAFRRTWLRTERYLLKERPIKGAGQLTENTMSKVVRKSISSASNDTVVQCPLNAEEPVVVELTETNLLKHNKRKSSTRVVNSPKRYKPDLTKLKDDLSASEVGSDEVPVEERSVDSRSIGSLKDFIVDDEDSGDESESISEKSFSSRETEDSQSFHSSALTDSESI